MDEWITDGKTGQANLTDTLQNHYFSPLHLVFYSKKEYWWSWKKQGTWRLSCSQSLPSRRSMGGKDKALGRQGSHVVGKRDLVSQVFQSHLLHKMGHDWIPSQGALGGAPRGCGAVWAEHVASIILFTSHSSLCCGQGQPCFPFDKAGNTGPRMSSHLPQSKQPLENSGLGRHNMVCPQLGCRGLGSSYPARHWGHCFPSTNSSITPARTQSEARPSFWGAFGCGVWGQSSLPPKRINQLCPLQSGWTLLHLNPMVPFASKATAWQTSMLHKGHGK